MTRLRLLLVAAILLLGGATAVAQLGTGKYPVLLNPSQISQQTLKVDNSTTPNRTEIGCEADQLGGTTVNGIRIVGAVTGTGPTISGVACTGGDTNRTLNLVGAGTGGVTIANGIDSTVTGAVFLPAMEVCVSTQAANGTVTTLQSGLVTVRVAQGDWALQRTAAGAETISIHCNLSAWTQRLASSKGVRIDSFSIVQQITTAALTSNTFNAASQVVYSNNVANAVTACCGTITITMPTATQANPYVTAATVGTPAFQTTSAAAWNLDWTAVLQNTGVYRVYGILVNYTLALY